MKWPELKVFFMAALGILELMLGLVLVFSGWWCVWDLVNTWVNIAKCDWSVFVFPLPFFLGNVHADKWTMAYDVASWISLFGTALVGAGCFTLSWLVARFYYLKK